MFPRRLAFTNTLQKATMPPLQKNDIFFTLSANDHCQVSQSQNQAHMLASLLKSWLFVDDCVQKLVHVYKLTLSGLCF